MKPDQKIREVLTRYGVPYEGNVWAVQGTPVIKHMACELLAAKAGIKYGPPTIIRAERDEAVIMVTATLGEETVWSIGEALVNVNYRVSGKQAGYVYAMAEKRGKDRCILKLVELHGVAYSEDEADDFKQRRVSVGESQDGFMVADPEEEEAEARARYIKAAELTIQMASPGSGLLGWWSEQKQARRDFGLSQAQSDALKNKVMAKMASLTPQKEAAE